ncbi:MAG TPA: antibiotic biosynthesis monooxygenase [Dehalococcoidales bacterium]|jgi:antibiotic biosynthesis monooxygenase (ABM) superfamily enzyme
MENDTMVRTGKDVTIVVSRTVFPGREKEYDEWVRQMVAAASEAPGNLGVTTLIPPSGKTGLYHVVFRFKDQASADNWENSVVRQRLTGEADVFSRSHRQAGTGLETWFTVPECPQLETPPHWKQAIITTIGVYAVSTLIIKVLGLFSLGWNFFYENILISALVVAALTWAIMPVLTRVVFRKWLYK